MASQFSMAILERETSAQIGGGGGGGLTCARRAWQSFLQLGSIVSLATETTGGEILVAFLAQTWSQKRSQSA